MISPLETRGGVDMETHTDQSEYYDCAIVPDEEIHNMHCSFSVCMREQLYTEIEIGSIGIANSLSIDHKLRIIPTEELTRPRWTAPEHAVWIGGCC